MPRPKTPVEPEVVDFCKQVADRVGKDNLLPLPQTEAELYAMQKPIAIPPTGAAEGLAASSERTRRVDPRRRPGKKIPCYWVHIRSPYEVRSLRFPHDIENVGERISRPKGHKFCRTVEEAYGVAFDAAETHGPSHWIEIRTKMGKDIVLISCQRGRFGVRPTGFAALSEVDNQRPLV